MKANHFHTGIIFSVALLLGAAAKGQVKTINVTAPPEIKLVPLPSRKIVTMEGWSSYYYYLKKYAIDNEVIWKEH